MHSRHFILQIVPDCRFQLCDIHGGVGLCHTDLIAECPNRFRCITSPANAGDGRHPRIVPTVYVTFVHHSLEVPLAHQGMGDVQTSELNLTRRIRPQTHFLQHPVVQRTVILKFQSADGMGNALNGIFNRMCEIVHRIDAPLVPRIVMGHVSYSVDDRISHVDVRGCHIDLGTENRFPVTELSVFHALKQFHVLFHASVPVRAFLSRLRQCSAVFLHLLRRQVAYVGLSLLNQGYCRFVHLIEIIRCPQSLVPLESQPVYIFLDGVHVFRIFLDRVGVVITKVAGSAVLQRGSEVQAQGFGMSDVEIAVWFRWKTSGDVIPLSGFQVVVDDVVDKIPSHLFVFVRFFVTHSSLQIINTLICDYSTMGNFLQSA